MEANQAPDRVVIALAGRRIDAPDTNPPRFPLENVPMVRQRLADMFAAEHAEALVCSAACGNWWRAYEIGCIRANYRHQ